MLVGGGGVLGGCGRNALCCVSKEEFWSLAPCQFPDITVRAMHRRSKYVRPIKSRARWDRAVLLPPSSRGKQRVCVSCKAGDRSFRRLSEGRGVA